MAADSEGSLRRLIIVGVCLLAMVTAASAGTIAFAGNFSADDDVQLFNYTVANLSMVTISTTSFAVGGFSPILTLFDSTGAFQFDNIGYSGNTEATLSWNSIANQKYIIALTQYDNVANGPSLSNGFVRDGQGNFTAAPPFNPLIPGGSFLLPGPEQRTSSWAVDFTSNDPTLHAAAIPEPSSAVSSLTGGVILAVWLAVSRRRIVNNAGKVVLENR